MVLDKENLKSAIKKNLNKFDQLEFCNDGGWPDFSSLDVIVYNQTEMDKGIMVKFAVFYHCVHSSACACYSTTNTTDSLTKEVFIGDDGSFEVL